MGRLTKRYILKGSDDFFQHIEDTTLTEDKHEGTINDIYQVVNRLNEQEEQIQELELKNKQLKQGKHIYGIQNKILRERIQEVQERNQRQYERLKEITDLMQNRDWKTLEEIVEDWERTEELLQREWNTYGDVK